MVVYHVVGIFDIRLFGGLRGRPVPSVGPLGLRGQYNGGHFNLLICLCSTELSVLC